MMETAMPLDMPQLLALASALGWASGFRLYAVVFLVGLSGSMDWINLPSGLHVLESPAMLLGSGVMLFVEFFADKIPGLDSIWDAVHSVIRIPAGAALVAGALGADSATMTTFAALMGGTLAASSQVAKTTTRAAINTSPDLFSNIAASLLEDGMVVAAVWLAVQYPFMFGISLTVAIAVLAFITITLFRFLRTALQRVSVYFSK